MGVLILDFWFEITIGIIILLANKFYNKKR